MAPELLFKDSVGEHTRLACGFRRLAGITTANNLLIEPWAGRPRQHAGARALPQKKDPLGQAATSPTREIRVLKIKIK